MIRNKLVDGMNTYGEIALSRICKDCIFGKYTSYPYNGTIVKERDVLEHVHIDLWGPAQVQLARDAYLSQTSFSYISINSLMILMVLTATESLQKDLSIDISHVSRQSVLAEILARSTDNCKGTALFLP